VRLPLRLGLIAGTISLLAGLQGCAGVDNTTDGGAPPAGDGGVDGGVDGTGGGANGTDGTDSADGADGADEPGSRGQPSTGTGTGTGTGTVVSVTDGDTLRLLVGDEELGVRLIGVDTPEVRNPAECYGEEATAALTALAPVGSTLGYAYDLERQDQYERDLLYLTAADGTLINLALVEEGAGRAVLFEPNDQFWDALQQAERSAQSRRAGLWGAC